MQRGHSDAVKQIMSIYCLSTVLAVMSCSNCICRSVLVGAKGRKI